MLDSCFIPFEAQQIRSIPLCVSSQADFLYWAFEKEGVYTVKLAYKVICEEENLAKASVSNSAATRDLWSGIWKLKVPGKIKHFLWRACTNCLPTKENLLQRKIVMDSICHRRGRCEETTMHSLWSCEVIKLVWCNDFSWINHFEATRGLLGFGWSPHVAPSSDGAVCYNSVAYMASQKQNQTQGAQVPLGMIRDAACKFLQIFQQSRDYSCSRRPTQSRRQQRWMPPKPGEYKINFDGAMFNESEEAGIGVMVRDSSGQVIAALAEKVGKPCNSELLEMLAAK